MEPVGEVVTRDDGLGVIRAQHPRPVSEQLLKLGRGLLHPTRLTKQGGEVVTRGEVAG
jgi:hypothetical protein